MFSKGTSDLRILKRAYQAMQRHLAQEWEARDAASVPYKTPYEALIMASIVEKETGRAEEREMIAGALVNRLKIGMLLQVDPSVIYGLGESFDGNLKKIHLTTDGPYNTYTRAGLPPTPIAAPGLRFAARGAAAGADPGAVLRRARQRQQRILAHARRAQSRRAKIPAEWPTLNSRRAVVAARGKFITLEGVDGAGKSTHVAWIAERLRAGGHEVVVTREPGGTPLAEKLRALVLAEAMDPLAETLLMFAARADHVQKVIAPALARGAWVVCDRFTDATLAYQGAGKGVPVERIRQLAEATHPGLAPDQTLVFDCPYEVSRSRLSNSGRDLDRFESEERAFFERVRAGYQALARAEPGRVYLLDGAPGAGKS